MARCTECDNPLAYVSTANGSIDELCQFCSLDCAKELRAHVITQRCADPRLALDKIRRVERSDNFLQRLSVCVDLVTEFDMSC